MTKPVKQTAAEKYAALTAREAEAAKERQADERRRSSKIDKLRALRLAKEETDRAAAAVKAAEKAAAAPKKARRAKTAA